MWADGAVCLGMSAEGDVLGLLAGGPQPATALARACGVRLMVMRRRLAAIQQAGQITRDSRSGYWRLVVVAERELETVADLAAVEAQIAYAPQRVSAIAKALGASLTSVLKALWILKDQGRAKLVGRGTSERWASRSWDIQHVRPSGPRGGRRGGDVRPRVGGRPATAFPPKPATTGSWWLDCANGDRRDFYRRLEVRRRGGFNGTES